MAEKADDQRPTRKRSAGKNIPRREQTSSEATRPTGGTARGETTPPTPARGARRTVAGAAVSTRQPAAAASTRPEAAVPPSRQRPRRPRPVPSATELAATDAAIDATPEVMPEATPATSEFQPVLHAAADAPSDKLSDRDVVIDDDTPPIVVAPSAEQPSGDRPSAEQPDDVEAILVIETDADTEELLDPALLSAAEAILDAAALAEAEALTEAVAGADAESLEAVLATEAELAAEEELSETMAELAAVGVGIEASQQVGSADTRRTRFQHNNALGMLIERTFEMPSSPCHSYSDLERQSRVSREAISRYVTPRPDRRRSPSIDSLVAIADAMHLSLEVVCRAAAASAKGVIPQADALVQTREDVLRTYIAHLSEEQFSAVVELLVQMRPLGAEK